MFVERYCHVFYGSTVRKCVRTAVIGMTITIVGAACASAPASGRLGEGSTVHPRITGVDSALPPRRATVQLEQREHAVLLLVAPGHSATLLYPKDSVTPNELSAGSHRIEFQIPDLLVASDSLLSLGQPRRDSMRLGRRTPGARSVTPIPPTAPTYLLLVTSPQPLVYARIVEKTAGVSIPTIDTEALNAVGKAIKSTLATEPREWAGYYQQIEVRRH
jgi:hypothetical protein